MKKNKKLGIIGLASVASLVVPVLATLSSCKKQNTNDLPEKIVDENGITYYMLSFVKPSGTEYDDVTLIGKTEVKIKEGYPFGTIIPPKAILDGYTLKGWAQQGSTELITPTTAIRSSMYIVPVMEPVVGTLTLDGPQTAYDGFNQHPVYTATISSGDANLLNWTIEDTEGQPSDLLTLDTTTGLTVTATIKHITEAETCFVVATYGTGTSAVRRTLMVTVYPPYYRSDIVQIQTQSIDTGTLYWLSIQKNNAMVWVGAKGTEVCSTDPEQAITFFDFINNTMQAEPRNSSVIGDLKDIYPGSEVNSIADGCWANATYFNAIMHGGVYTDGTPKIITIIGNDFLLNCTSFNQNINDIFDFDGPLTIADNFMDGCTGFNNGETVGTQTTILLPKALHIGNGFMSDCTGLYADITIPAETQYIGDFFMNGCSHIKTLTISADSNDTLEYVGTWFMADCDDLEQVHLYCSDIGFMSDRFAELSDKGAFVKYGTATTETPYTYVDGVSSAVDELLSCYPSVTYDTYYRKWAQGSITGKTIIIPAKGTQEYIDMFEPDAVPTYTNDENGITKWTGTFKNITITSPEAIGTITAECLPLDVDPEYEFFRNPTVEVVSEQQIGNTYYKTINVKIDGYYQIPQRKAGYPLKITLLENGTEFFNSSNFLYKVDKRIEFALISNDINVRLSSGSTPQVVLDVPFSVSNPYNTQLSQFNATVDELPTGIKINGSIGSRPETNKITYSFSLLSSTSKTPPAGIYSLKMSVIEYLSYDKTVDQRTIPFVITPLISPYDAGSKPGWVSTSEENVYRFYFTTTILPKVYALPAYGPSDFYFVPEIISTTVQGEVLSANIIIESVDSTGVVTFRPEFFLYVPTGQIYGDVQVRLNYYSPHVPGDNKLIRSDVVVFTSA